MSTVNNSDSDSGAFGYFLRIINWSPVDKSAQQVSKKNPTLLAGTQCIELLTDLPIYSCRIAGQFASNVRSRTRLTIRSLSGITIYRNTLRPFWTPDHFGPSFRSHLLSFWSKFV